MPWYRPTLTELIHRTEADFQSRMPNQEGALLRRSVLAVIARVQAGVAHLLHGHLAWNAEQLLPDTSEAEILQRQASVWGLSRKAAGYAAGDVELTGQDGSVVPAGTKLQRSDGVRYTTDAEVTISGTTVVGVTAVEAGESGNADAGVTLSFVSPIAGVDSTATVASGGITGGTDRESDEELRSRLLARIQQPPHGGADFDYKAWALEISGVTRVWVYPSNSGPGTVGVTFVMDDSDPIIPGSTTVDEVQSHIDDLRPVTADVTVFAPTAAPLDITVKIKPNTADVRDAIQAELADMFKRDAEPGGTILISHLREAVAIAAGETDHEFVSPTSNVYHSAGEMPTLGTITFQDL